MLGIPCLADAQTVKIGNINTSGTFAYDGLQFTISNCNYSVNNVAQSNCKNADIEAEVFSNRGQPTIEFLGNGLGSNGSAALRGTPGSGNTTSVNFRLAVAVIASGKTGYKAGTTLTGASNALSESGYVSGTTIYADAVCTAGCSNLNTSTPTTLFAASPVFASQNLSLTVTLGLSGNGSSTLVLNDAALHFSPAPEPATIALLATGLTGLLIFRRRFRHPAKARPNFVQ